MAAQSSCWAQHGAAPTQGPARHHVLGRHTDPTQAHCWAQEQHASPSSRGAPFWVRGPTLMHCRQGEGAEACPCLLLVIQKRRWSVSVVAMGIGMASAESRSE